jgi:recombination protein RecR
LENIGPDELFIDDLLKRVIFDTGSKRAHDPVSLVKEIIIATNPTMEGNATAMFIDKQLKIADGEIKHGSAVKITRLGMGIPTGADLEYADETTLTQALEGRREL